MDGYAPTRCQRKTVKRGLLSAGSVPESKDQRAAKIGYSIAHGFTVIELVTTIVIIGILGAVVVPRFLDNVVFSQRGYVDELASSLRYAQRIAIASECPVQFNSNAAGYSAFQRSWIAGDCTGNWTVLVLRSDGTQLSGIASVNAGAAPDAIIEFDLAGNVTNGVPPVLSVGPFTLTVAQAGGLVTVLP